MFQGFEKTLPVTKNTQQHVRAYRLPCISAAPTSWVLRSMGDKSGNYSQKPMQATYNPTHKSTPEPSSAPVLGGVMGCDAGYLRARHPSTTSPQLGGSGYFEPQLELYILISPQSPPKSSK